MGNSKHPFSLGLGDLDPGQICPARTPGSLGINDHADPSGWSLFGDTPGPIGICSSPVPKVGFGFAAQLSLAGQKVMSAEELELIGEQNCPEFVLLAAVSYGEASWKNVAEEMAAIAKVIVRQKEARKTSIAKLLGPNSSYAFAASDGNARTGAFLKASPKERLANSGMVLALKAAQGAMGDGFDCSSGAYFWDGADIKSNYANHPKVKLGIKFTDPKHNIYGIAETSVDKTEYWLDANKKPTANARGKYKCVYESTAAYGGTIFWKYGADFLKATGNKVFA